MSRIFITIGSAYSKAANVNPVDGIWCSDMCGNMADAVPVADAVHNLSYLLDTPIAIRVREKRGQGFGGLTDGKERRLHGKAF